jgi:CheY-like chemotaxis protein
MQGSIQISSSPGTGTQVAIEIPLAPIGRPTSIPTLTPTFDPNITGTILLVDDSEANRLIARHLIQKHMPNVKILEAACGEDSIALAKAHQPRVILMDLRLPNISGSQATATILASQESAQPWVFGLTADPGEAAIGDAYAAGMRGIIMKPFDAADLATCLAQAIQEATEARITRLT